jgi:hypothetical protein
VSKKKKKSFVALASQLVHSAKEKDLWIFLAVSRLQQQQPVTRQHSIWAHSVHKLKNTFFVYFSALCHDKLARLTIVNN